MVIPKQYLKTIKRTGLGKGLFSEQRYKDDGSENPDFILNKPAYRNAKILVAGDNFGCGSSREHAPWALLDFGIRCVISTSFGDIFYNNCFKNGILPIRVSQEDLDKLFDDAERGANATLIDRSCQSGNPRPRRRHGEIRDRSVPQALPDERPRRYRADHGEEGLDRQPTRRRPRPSAPGPDPAIIASIEGDAYAARRRHLLARSARCAAADLPADRRWPPATRSPSTASIRLPDLPDGVGNAEAEAILPHAFAERLRPTAARTAVWRDWTILQFSDFFRMRLMARARRPVARRRRAAAQAGRD